MEEWKDIEGWEGKYQVSNYGDIKRLERDITDILGRTKHYTEKIFHPHKANNGYTRVSFGTERDLTHRVVAKAFLPNPQNLPEVNHKDGHRKDFNFAGTKENNYEDGNLEWVNRKENMLHASRTGLINKDSKKRKISTALNQKKSVEKALRPVALLDDENNVIDFTANVIMPKEEYYLLQEVNELNCINYKEYLAEKDNSIKFDESKTLYNLLRNAVYKQYLEEKK